MLDQFTNNDREVLKSFAKALPKNSIFNFATCVNYRNGKLAITDGFGILTYNTDIKYDFENTYTKDLSSSPVKYPKYEQVFPDSSLGDDIDGESIASLVSALSNSAKNIWLEIKKDGEIKLTTKRDNQDSIYFNPQIIKNFLKPIPSGKFPSKAKLIDNKFLIVEYDNKFKLLTLSLKRN